jgi:hypothetical protein
MSGWGSEQYDPRQQRPAMPAQRQQGPPPGYQTPPWPAQDYHQQPQWQPQQYQAPQQPVRRSARRAGGLTAAGAFWYVLQCIALGAGYFAKVPAKKALQDFGMAQMTAAEQFWYVLMCIGFGAGYFAKLPVAKALSEMQRR